MSKILNCVNVMLNDCVCLVYHISCVYVQGIPGRKGIPGEPGEDGRRGPPGDDVSRITHNRTMTDLLLVLYMYHCRVWMGVVVRKVCKESLADKVFLERM